MTLDSPRPLALTVGYAGWLLWLKGQVTALAAPNLTDELGDNQP